MRLRIRHETVYRYTRPVPLLEHRLMLFPRGGPDVAVRSASLVIGPEPALAWSEDAAGNTVATATFAEPTAALSIAAEHVVDHQGEAWPIFRIAPEAHSYPFDYAADLRQDLAPALATNPGEADDLVARWVRGLAGEGSTDTLTLLQRISTDVNRRIAYLVRGEEGTQTAAETLGSASGSCRDLAALFIEGVRALGLAARAASGYLHDPEAPPGMTAATHAWAQVFLPGAGWIAFDPTAGRVGSHGLVTAAVGRSSDRVLPVVGGFAGAKDDLISMHVDVSVRPD